MWHVQYGSIWGQSAARSYRHFNEQLIIDDQKVSYFLQGSSIWVFKNWLGNNLLITAKIYLSSVVQMNSIYWETGVNHLQCSSAATCYHEALRSSSTSSGLWLWRLEKASEIGRWQRQIGRVGVWAGGDPWWFQTWIDAVESEATGGDLGWWEVDREVGRKRSKHEARKESSDYVECKDVFIFRPSRMFIEHTFATSDLGIHWSGLVFKPRPSEIAPSHLWLPHQ